MEKNEVEALKILSLASDGSGVARGGDGRAVFTPFTAPGDTAEVKYLKVEKRLAYAKLERLIEPSPERCEPGCPAYGRCGGCSLRHVEYGAQLAAKRGFVKDALERIGGLEASVADTIPSPLTDRCRNKAQYPVFEKDGALAFGFYAPRSHRPVPLGDCPLEPEEMPRAAREICDMLTSLGVRAYDEGTRAGTARHILLRRAQSGDMLACLVLNAGGFHGEDEFACELVRRRPEIKTVVINANTAATNVILGGRFRTIYGGGFIDEELLGVPVRLGAAAFFQVNKGAAELLYKEIARLAALREGDNLLDLYCGAGTIGLSLALSSPVGSLIGVETVVPAVEAARAAALELGLAGRCEFITQDAGRAAQRLALAGRRIDVAVADPPRRGCGEQTLDALVRMAPRRIVMVSCNPATLARDLKYLDARGYRAEEASPVDMFPHTPHVETVVLMSRVK